MTETVVVMVTVSERIALLNQFLASLAEHEPGRPIFVHMQGDDAQREIVWPRGLTHEYMHTPERLGCHAARVRALRRLSFHDYRTFINVDDDVLLLPETNWQPAIDFTTSQPGTGFVLTGWVSHPSKVPHAIGIMAEEFVPQVMVYNGGGMAYTEATARLIRALPPVPARYDDIWPMTAYLDGRRNYRYRGSLAVHAIMQRGGMHAYMRAEPRPLLCQDWIDYRRLIGQAVGSDVAIPQDRDIRPEARLAHRQRRLEQGWPLSNHPRHPANQPARR
jgi:hypothetical protein